ncbi:MAG: hypothetical protein LBS52_04115 [Dysgonamonadaceae bacterium]|jgi:hypothetical protein|nr:hypothetical protein [Dysgonamonadaceae bacterium]
MKYKISFLSLVAALTFFACDSDDNAGNNEITLDTNYIVSDVSGTSKSIAVTANCDWTAVTLSDWLTISPDAGSKNTSLSVTISKNEGEKLRRATIDIIADGETLATVLVEQNGYAPSLLISGGTTEFDYKGGTVSLTIASNGDEWEYTNPAASWLTETDKTATSLSFSVPFNEGNERIAPLVFKLVNYPSITWEIAIVQKANTTVPTFVLPETPSTSEINLGNIEDQSFTWTAENISDGFSFIISSTQDMKTPVYSLETTNLQTSVPSIALDLALFRAGIASGASESLYWTVKPVNAEVELTKPVETRELKLKRPELATDATHGDMLDAVFAPDTTATDVSGFGHTIQRLFNDKIVKVVYNKTYRRYEAVFNPKGGQNANNADCFKIDYQTDQNFKDKLADGHSFECLIKFDHNFIANPVNYETKFFSTQESGGTGFMISNNGTSSRVNEITFLPNISPTPSTTSVWRWGASTVKPDGETYYHVVGVWNKTTQKVQVYIDGTPKIAGGLDAPGDYRPSSATSNWVGIGGDPGGANFTNCFIGRIVIARIYDRPLTDTEVTALWNQLK